MAGGETLDATLDLDYAEAIAGASGLTDAIEQAMEEGATAGAAAISEAIAGATGTVEIDVDTTTAEASISALGDQPPIEIPADVDAALAEASLQAITRDDPVEIPVEVDEGSVQGSLEAISRSDPVEIPVDIDEGGAVSELNAIGSSVDPIDLPVDVTGGDQVDELTSSLDDAADSGGHAKEGMDSAGSSAALLGGVSAAAKGDIGGVAEKLREVGPGAAVAVGGTVAAAAGIHELVQAGISGKDATTTFNQTLGTFADQVEHIHVGTLNTSLTELGHNLGSTDSEMKLAAASAFRYADAAGHGGETSARFTTEVLALAGRAVGLNSALGPVSEVAETLTSRLGRGGARLAQYGISLSSAEIKSHALALGLGDLSGNLSTQEKAIAGADLAAQKYGSSIESNVKGASQLASVQISNLSARFREAVETIGKPLVVPAIDSLKALVPIGTAAATILGSLGNAVLPAVAATAGPVASAVDLLGSSVSKLPQPVLAAGAGFALLQVLLNHSLLGATQLGGAVQGVLEPLRGATGIAAAAGIAIGVAGVQSGNTAQAVLGLAGAGAALGFAFGGPVGAGIGVATGALVGFGAVLIKNLTDSHALEDAERKLGEAISSESTPAIIQATQAAFDLFPAHQKVAQGARELQSAQSGILDVIKATGQEITPLTAKEQLHFAQEKQNEIQTKAWTEAQKGGITTMLATVSAWNQMGVSTEKYQLDLDKTIAASQLATQSHAALQSAVSPLTTSLKTAAQAAGEEATQTFDSLNAIGASAEAHVKATGAHEDFIKAVASGSAENTRYAAVVDSVATRQAAYADALVAGVAPQQAATQAIAAQREELVNLRDSLPAGELHDQVQGLIDDLDRLAAQRPKPVVSIQDDASAQLSTILGAISTFQQGGPRKIPLTIDALEPLHGLEQVQQAIAVITADPHQAKIILDDLVTGKVDDIKARFDALPAEKKVVATVEALGLGGIDDIASKMGQLNDKEVHALVTAIGEGGVQSLILTMQGMTDVDRNATAHALGFENLASLAQVMLSTPNVDRDAVAHALGFPDLASLAGAMLSTPNVDRNAVAHALGFPDLESLKASIAGVQGKDVYVTVHHRLVVEPGATDAPMATGGVVKAATGINVGGGFTYVGEHGPELAALPIGTRVISNPNTRSLLQSAARGVEGGGGDINIAIDARGATEDAVKMLRRTDWRDISRQIDQRSRSRSFLGGR